MQKTKKIFITATNTDIGKTYTTCALLKKYAQQGYRVGAMKPIETGVKTTPKDGEKLLNISKKYNPLFKDLQPNEITPITLEQPAAPFVANNLKEIELTPIFTTMHKLEKLCDILFIEGAGGLYVPIGRNFYMIDLIKQLEVDSTLLVTHCELGCINDTMLSTKALETAQLEYEVIFNCKNGSENFQTTSKPFLELLYTHTDKTLL